VLFSSQNLLAFEYNILPTYSRDKGEYKRTVPLLHAQAISFPDVDNAKAF
jgi:hypothetical protein